MTKLNYEFHKNFVLRTPAFSFKKDIRGDSEENSIFKEALFLASPDLANSYGSLDEIKNKKKSEKIVNSVHKYKSRMQSRCTPFGLFAGCSVGEWSEETRIKLSNIKAAKRHTRLDMNYLCALAQFIGKQDYIKPYLRFVCNSSLYQIFDKYRFVEYQYNRIGRRVHSTSSVDFSEPLQLIINIVKEQNGLTLPILTTKFLELEKSFEKKEVEAFIVELVDSQVLVSELEPSITGDEFFDQLYLTLQKIYDLSPSKELLDLLELLKKVNEKLELIDQKIGNDVSLYFDIVHSLKKIGVSFALDKLFQTDLIRTSEELQLNKNIQHQLIECLQLTSTLKTEPKKTNLDLFAEKFSQRYETAEIPLLNALDNETGIGYIKTFDGRGDINPLIDDLVFPNNSNSNAFGWNEWTQFLHRKVIECYRAGAKEINLNKKELTPFQDFENQKLPNSIPVLFSNIGDIDGKNKYLLHGMGGSSAANFLSRFSHGDKNIHKIVQDISKEEENAHQNAIIAEIVHLPEDRIGNILLRPVIRKYEIPYLSKPGVDSEYVIHPEDLYVSVRNKKIILRSRKLNKVIIPSLTSAHNYSNKSLPVYQFLCDLQHQNTRKNLTFNWLHLKNIFPFLPRVTYKNIILSRAMWNFKNDDFQHLIKIENEKELLNEVNNFKVKNNLPDQVVLADGDNELIADFNDLRSILAFLSTIKNRPSIKILEHLFDADSCIVKNQNDETYLNQFLAILINQDTPNHYNAQRYQDKLDKHVTRGFSLGSEWVYMKFYCGYNSADRIIRELLLPLSNKMIEMNLIDRWFFLRYSDPNNHIRIRFRLNDPKNIGQLISILSSSIKPLEDSRMIWKTAIDTYQREIERYGSKSIEFVEELFYYDSKATALMLNCMAEQKENLDLLPLFSLSSIDSILNSFNYSLENKVQILNFMRSSFYNEFQVTKTIKRQIDKKYRSFSENISEIIERTYNLQKVENIYALIDKREKNSETAIKNILLLQENNQLDVSLVNLISSIIHMNMNRIFKSKQRVHELVIYDYLYRFYNSKLAQTSKS